MVTPGFAAAATAAAVAMGSLCYMACWSDDQTAAANLDTIRVQTSNAQRLFDDVNLNVASFFDVLII